jgi:hypothetical protein
MSDQNDDSLLLALPPPVTELNSDSNMTDAVKDGDKWKFDQLGPLVVNSDGVYSLTQSALEH